ncbi:hypothetical protein WICPIJ_007085 [Wickerhamomyces pijperi]|uniref:Secreted protein n=1 Tax=Wickerhamomyces pijperi TaxID=599730 RepID=A0A9P8Q0I1_WICPI|nr:hypothetical protein WICPIJ_007085 [Wickerhamomyces pijperi]
MYHPITLFVSLLITISLLRSCLKLSLIGDSSPGLVFRSITLIIDLNLRNNNSALVKRSTKSNFSSGEMGFPCSSTSSSEYPLVSSLKNLRNWSNSFKVLINTHSFFCKMAKITNKWN